jgi:hypothetical protein
MPMGRSPQQHYPPRKRWGNCLGSPQGCSGFGCWLRRHPRFAWLIELSRETDWQWRVAGDGIPVANGGQGRSTSRVTCHASLFCPRSSVRSERHRAKVEVAGAIPAADAILPLCLSSDRASFVNSYSSVQVRPGAPFNGDHNVTAASRPVKAFVPVRIRLVTPISTGRIITACPLLVYPRLNGLTMSARSHVRCRPEIKKGRESPDSRLPRTRIALARLELNPR